MNKVIFEKYCNHSTHINKKEIFYGDTVLFAWILSISRDDLTDINFD